MAGSFFRRIPGLATRIVLGIVAFIVFVIVVVSIASFFLDGIIRPRIENTMNQKLKGYHVTLAHAHVQLLDGVLRLNGLKIVQQKHPRPPVADLDLMQFQIQWGALFTGHVVADLLLYHPVVHIDLTQFKSEKKSKVPLHKKGWQQAVESIYPFKVNRFRIRKGDVTYVDPSQPNRPLHVEDLNFTAENIRNVRSAAHVYPSPIYLSAIIFDSGHLKVDGRANFFADPYPGVLMNYDLSDVPLEKVDPAATHVNVKIKGGTLSSRGQLEYAPQIAKAEVYDANIDDMDVNYIHTAQTQKKEAATAKETGKTVEKENERPGVLIAVHHFNITRSAFAFTDKSKDPNYSMFISDCNVKLTNLGNHKEQGTATVDLHGKFMGSGDTAITGHFAAEKGGPDFVMNVAIQNTELPSLNDMLRAYGRFDVQAGLFSLFAQMGVYDRNINGYVKPMFSDLQVYSHQKDKNKPVLKKAEELAMQAAAKVLKNRKTQQVATKVYLSGKLSGPNTSIIEAIIEVLRNAFIKAILPGFDRQVQTASSQPQQSPPNSGGGQ